MSAKSRQRRRAKEVIASPLLRRLYASQESFTDDYASREAAEAAMLEQLRDEESHDNIRFAFIDDTGMMRAYENAASNGCCGSYDRLVTVTGKAALIGCNYGH